MDRGNFRSLLKKLSLSRPANSRRGLQGTADLPTTTASPSFLTTMVGRALGMRAVRGTEQSFDALEPRSMLDGSFINPHVVAIDGAGQGSFAEQITPATPSTDSDYFRFVAPTADFVSVLADTSNESPSSTLDTKVTVYAADTTTVVASGSTNGRLTRGIARDGWAGFVAQAGATYFVVVNSESSAAGTYTLRIGAQSTTFDVGGEAPQDTGIGREAGSPVPAPPLIPITPILGQLARRQQDIVYKFVAPSTPADTAALYDSLITVNAQSTQVANLSRRLDTRLDVYNASGQLVTSDSDSGRINDAFTTFKALPGDTFYIRVRSDEILNANANLATGPFFLVFDAIATTLTPNPVTRLVSTAGAFTGFGDPTTPPTPAVPSPVFQTDSYSFKAIGSGTTIITVQPTGLAPVNDPAIRLYDATGTLIAFNDNYVGTSSQLEVQLESDKRYFLVIDGFEISSQVQYTLDIETHHTTDTSTTTPVDDHVNNPIFGGGAITGPVRRQFEQATPLVWGQAHNILDGNNNPINDRGYVADASGTGRIYQSGDTDMFKFVPQVDMLSDHPGDNNDAGTSLFIGGSFNQGNTNAAHPTTSRNLTSFDASSYWYAGAQYFDAQAGVTYGFNDNTDTLRTAGPEIYALADWDPFPTQNPTGGLSDHILLIGGDFTLVIPGLFGPVFFRNFVGWGQDQTTGEWGFVNPFGAGDSSTNGPVRAFQTYNPVGFDPDGSGPAAALPDPSGPVLCIGGDFTDIAGTFDGTTYTPAIPVNFVAAFDRVQLTILDVGIGLNAPVHALTTYDPPDPGAGRPAAPPPNQLTEVLDPYDPPISLIIGGEFTGGITTWDGRAGVLTPLAYSSPSLLAQPATVNGVVNALTVFNDPDPDGAAGPDQAQDVLIIAGSFTNAGPLTNVGNIVKFGRPNSNPATTDPSLPGYNPFIKWEKMVVAGGVDGPINALTTWDPADLNSQTIDPILIIGGEFGNSPAGAVGNIVGYGKPNPASTAAGAFVNAFGNGTNGAVRSLAVIPGSDAEEPGIATNLRTGAPQDPLYVGGDFTAVWDATNPNPNTDTIALGVAQFSGFRGRTTDFFNFSQMGRGGVTRTNDIFAPTDRPILADSSSANDGFGHSISIYGETMVVGSWLDDVGGNVDQGSVSIYSRITGSWALLTTLTAAGGRAGDKFGSSVAIMGDRLVVGASGADIAGAVDRGCAYVFNRAGNTYNQVTQLLATGGAAGDNFGASVSMYGASIIVGAPLDDVGARIDQGSAYVFVFAANAWSQQAQINGTGGLAGDNFGSSVAIDADTVVVGAENDDVGANVDQGSAFVFTRAGTVWTQRRLLNGSNSAARDHFGHSVSIFNRTIAIGAPDADLPGAADQGTAYIFTGAAATWAQAAPLVAGDGAAGDHFGTSVAASSTIVAVGASGADVNGLADQGAVYTFGSANATQIAKNVATDGAAGDLFGTSVAVSEGTFVAGSPGHSVGGQAAAGKAYTFDAAAKVFSLGVFDDGNPFAWDHRDRRATRLAINASPGSGSFLNLWVRVYDSNLNLIYGFDKPGSNTISPPFPDPAGMIDESLSAPQADRTLEGIKVWGGETYYIEISAGPGANGAPAFGLGRYNFTVTADALPPDLAIPPASAPDGTFDDMNAVWVPESTEGSFSTAIKIPTGLGSGDGNNYVDTTTQPLHGNSQKFMVVTPSINGFYQMGFDIGNISNLADTDIYYFRAEFSGTAEIRLATLGLTDNYAEQTVDATTGVVTSFASQTKTYSSSLDGALRIFDNDFQQVAYNNDSAGVVGEFQAFTVGNTNASFRRTDPRVVVKIEAGKQYFIQVESGQRYKDGAAINPADRVTNIAREIEWGSIAGSYEVLIHAMPQQIQDIENGVFVTDDHTNTTLALATVINIADDGTGSLTGVLNNTPLNLLDQDLMTFISPGFGQVRVSLTKTTQSLSALMRLYRYDPVQNNLQLVGDAQPSGVDQLVISTSAAAGTRFYVLTASLNNSEGDYRIDVSGVPFVDDNADFGKWSHATDITMYDFRGTGEVSGNIEVSGDTDVFRFQAITYQRVTATVTSLDTSLVAAFTIYEVSEDPNGNPIYLRVANNDNAAATNTPSASFPASINRIDGANSFPYYYVVVRGSDPNTDRGRYKLTLAFTATDDHADGSTIAPFTAFDTGEFAFATNIAIDPATGVGASTGKIEIVTDSDLFKFTAATSGDSTIIVSRPSNSRMRPQLSIVDSNANIILDNTGALAQLSGSDETSGPSASASVTITAVRGVTYYIIVQGWEDVGVPNVNTTITGTYNLSVNTPPTDDYPNAGEWALSNTQAAISVSAVSGLGQLGGTAFGDPTNPKINPVADTDLFNFTTKNAGAYSITVTPFSATVFGLAPKVTVFIANGSGGTQVGQVIATAALQAVTVTITGAAANVRYYVLVEARLSVPRAAAGEYSVGIAGPGAPVGTDPGEIDFASPTVITLNSRNGDGCATDSINVAGDRDLFKFRVAASGKVYLQLLTPQGSLLNASISAYNQANEQLSSRVAFDADGLAGVAASASFDAVANTDYWVIVAGQGSSVGSYQLCVDSRPAANFLYFPEGFADDNTHEYVSIVNPNNVTANYSVFLRYEDSDVQTVIANGTVAANSRGGLTIIDGTLYSSPGIRKNSPYSVIVQSDQPLGATFAHYDFGSAIGDAFTERLSTQWNFPRVERDSGNVLDFITFFNPSAFSVDVTLTAYQTDQPVAALTKTFAANRRGGFNINDIPNFPTGIFSVVLTSTPTNPANAAAYEGVAASLSHYEGILAPNQYKAGWGLLGDADNGSTAGAITNFTKGSFRTSEATFFNPNDVPTTVTLTGTYISGSLPQFTRTFDIKAKSQVRFTDADFGLISDQTVGLTYTSSLPISAAGANYQQGDADSSSAAMNVGTRFLFGDAFMDPALAGNKFFEYLYLYNPTAANSTVAIKLNFTDGTSSTFAVTVNSKGFAQVKLHERAELTSRSGPTWFAIDASSTSVFAMSMTHYDLLLDGGFGTTGVPLGFVNPISRVP